MLGYVNNVFISAPKPWSSPPRDYISTRLSVGVDRRSAVGAELHVGGARRRQARWVQPAAFRFDSHSRPPVCHPVLDLPLAYRMDRTGLPKAGACCMEWGHQTTCRRPPPSRRRPLGLRACVWRDGPPASPISPRPLLDPTLGTGP